MSHSSRKFLPALLVAITGALITQPMRGQMPTPTPVVTFTEINDTTLTAVYTNGSGVSTNLTVAPGGPTDSWRVVTTLASPNIGTVITWTEPSPTNSVNEVVEGGLGFDIVSDISGSTGVFANDTMTSFPIASDISSGSPVSVYGIFNDLGDTPAAGVPDSGTTASLFGFALAGLAFLRRKLC